MQSFLQYRNFRDAARAQIERDKRRSGADQPSSSQTSEESKVDLEKGEGSDQAPLETRVGDGLSNNGRKSAEEESNKSPQALEPAEEKDEEDQEEEDDDDFELSHARRTLSRTTTQQSTGTALGQALTGIEVRRRTTREGGEGNVFVVGYESPDDPNDPHNWSTPRRLRCTVVLALIGAVVGFASAVDSPAIPQAAKDFGVSEVVESLATGIFLIG